ncbi:Coenzyme F420 hydrogenase/dehydrogenase, beta subunit C-terminal domain [bacterium]|nr:Coenzyme F420 hydrogenase/dehydrogenase, beta subunit C-terminal domain [bacterium]
MSTAFPNIDSVGRRHLCTECGACWGICPKSNIRIDRAKDRDYVFRVIDPAKCGACDLCARVCSGIEVDFDALRETVFPGQAPDPWFGVVRESYLSRSTDPDAVRRGASGGTATTLLEFGLETGRIDGALVVGMGARPPLEPKVFVARTVEELHSATQSKYCPAPNAMSLREVMATDGRYAMVALPCQTHALRKAQTIFPKLRERVVFVVGLYCGPGPSFHMMDHLVNRRGVAIDDVVDWHFRDKRVTDGSWPGGILAETATGDVRIPLARYLYAQTLFTRRRCHVCPDYGAEFADVSMGDAHLHEFWSDPPDYESPSGRVLHGPDGWNAVVVRTETGVEWFQAARDAGKLDAEPLPLAKLKEGMAHACFRKKNEFWTRLRIHKLLRRTPPVFRGLVKPKLTMKQRIVPTLRMIIGELIHLRPIRWILAHLPERVLLMKLGWRQKLICKARDEQTPKPT